ncbi:MAG: DUF547 domain-containing protein, partial [Planctomycetota bacterium]
MEAPQGKSYFGPLFWLGAVALLVPVFVAFKAFEDVSKPYEVNPDLSGVDHGLWDQLLKKYVRGGLVNYAGLGADPGFRTYVSQLGRARPEKLSTESERLALLCNAYNAFVMNGVIVRAVGDSVMDVKEGDTGFFDLSEHILGGETVSLNHIEHGIIRKRFA